MHYVIKQWKDKINYPFFLDYEYARKHGFDLSKYESIYEGLLEDEKDVNPGLEKIFTIFNNSIPSDFKGHSLSVGDVVELDGVDYFVEPVGFTKVQ